MTIELEAAPAGAARIPSVEHALSPHRSRAALAAIVTIALLLLTAPALWNGYPLLQFDTGGYLARWYEGYLVPSRSTVFGLYLHLGEGLHFWPEILAQSALTIWIVGLTLRVFGVSRRPRHLMILVATMALLTSLPWLASILLTDIFAGLGLLALHLLIFHPGRLARAERIALFATIAFAVATHSATLAMLLAVLGAALLVKLVFRRASRLIGAVGLLNGAAALVTGAVLLLSANYALSGQFRWTPGGYGLAFGRMLQDGIVARYLNEHCAEEHLKLCPFRSRLPATADEFLWGYGVFNELGRFAGLDDEMRTIVLRSLIAYPGQQLASALRATARQLVLVATGAGVHDQLDHTYGIIERYIPGEVPAMRAARQQHGELGFDRLNRIHVPVALASMLALLALLARFARDGKDDIAWLAASASVAILANAFVCGVLSGPHDRYGARIAWIATFVVLIAAMRARASKSPRANLGFSAHTTVS
jgi:ethanolamine utilization microcompartment shell protein EutS